MDLISFVLFKAEHSFGLLVVSADLKHETNDTSLVNMCVELWANDRILDPRSESVSRTRYEHAADR